MVEHNSRRWQQCSQTTKKQKMFTAVIHKDADHTRVFHCCHGAVGQDNQRSSGKLNYHVYDQVANK